MNDSVPLDPDQLLDHVAWVRRLAARLLRDPANADDAAQETMLVALDRGPRDRERVRPWLAAVIRSVARRIRRSAERRTAREHAASRAEALPATDDLVLRASLLRAVVDGVVALPEPYRTSILLRFFEDLSAREIARRRSEPVETVRTRLKRGLAILRAKLASELEVETGDGGRARGLEALALLVEPARAGLTAATVATTTGTTGGVILMTAKSKIALFAITLLAGTMAIRQVLRDRSPAANEAEGTPALSRSAPSLDRTLSDASRTPISPAQAADVDPDHGREAPTSTNDDLPDLTTDQMESVTEFDSDDAIEETISGLLNGEANLGRFMSFAVGVVEKAKLVKDSSKYAQTRPPGKRKWIVYRNAGGTLSRASIERFTAGTGDSTMFRFASPFATSRLAVTPKELARASVQLESWETKRDPNETALQRGAIELGLLPDCARANGIESFWSLIEYQSRGGCGKTLSFVDSGGRLLTQMVPYPRVIGDHETEAVDVDWSSGRAVDDSLRTEARKLTIAIDALIDR